MTRSSLERIIRAAGATGDDSGIAIIGSQAVPGQFPDADAALLLLIDGSIGEGSPFEREFGYMCTQTGRRKGKDPAFPGTLARRGHACKAEARPRALPGPE
jgi:hypothetical protein